MSTTRAVRDDGGRMSGPVKWLDERIGLAGLSKKQLRKVFPDHWSFMLGEIALWSFVILLLTGVFLMFWYTPSIGEVTYTGSYARLRGLHMSEAYESTLVLVRRHGAPTDPARARSRASSRRGAR
jgi:ubiquinol-cytochrome c reductase cytochrome b subunit